MATLGQQRCLNHAAREAVARCPECHQSFCRECVTEHDGRILCAACLRAQTPVEKAAHTDWSRLGRVVAAVGGLLLAWGCFYLAGHALLDLPSDFHEGQIWHSSPEETE